MPYITGIIECYEKLFVIISKEKEFITLDDLIKALTIQTKEHAKNGGKQRFIREIFLDQNIMSVEQITEVCDVVFQKSALPL